MLYDLFGIDLNGFQGPFYVFCLGVLVYRYFTVGRKYPLFSRREKDTDRVVSEASNNTYLNPVEYDQHDITDLRSTECWCYEQEQNQRHDD
jgi:hypothetical protein